MVDIPGTYSLMAHSVEEEVARDFICFGDPDAVVVVCDATCLERNMNLVLQTLEITDRVVVCVNLMDEARKKHIEIDFGKLSENLGVPVVGASARSREGLDELMDAVGRVVESDRYEPVRLRYPQAVEDALALLAPLWNRSARAGSPPLDLPQAARGRYPADRSAGKLSEMQPPRQRRRRVRASAGARSAGGAGVLH